MIMQTGSEIELSLPKSARVVYADRQAGIDQMVRAKLEMTMLNSKPCTVFWRSPTTTSAPEQVDWVQTEANGPLTLRQESGRYRSR